MTGTDKVSIKDVSSLGDKEDTGLRSRHGLCPRLLGKVLSPGPRHQMSGFLCHFNLRKPMFYPLGMTHHSCDGGNTGSTVDVASPMCSHLDFKLQPTLGWCCCLLFFLLLLFPHLLSCHPLLLLLLLLLGAGVGRAVKASAAFQSPSPEPRVCAHRSNRGDWVTLGGTGVVRLSGGVEREGSEFLPPAPQPGAGAKALPYPAPRLPPRQRHWAPGEPSG